MKSKAIVGSIFFVLLFVAVIYFFVRDSSNPLLGEKGKLEANLTSAQGKLSKDKDLLEKMINDLRSSFAFAIDIQDQMSKATAIVQKTDFIFIDPYGANPQLLVDNPLGLDINAERKNINILLSLWQSKMSLAYTKSLTAQEKEQIIKEAEAIQKYLEDLLKILGSLSPDNSGISQFQIDLYTAKLPTLDDIGEVITTITTTTETNNSATNTPPPTNPNITPEDVLAQQQVVQNDQNEVSSIQEHIHQIEEELNPTPEPPPLAPVVPPPQPISPSGNSVDPSTRKKYPDIIVQPGPPKLIQGEDPY